MTTAEPSLGARALAGTVWSLSFSVLNKGITLVSQWVLAWLLLEEDFGLFAPANFVMSLMMIAGGGHFSVLLVQRQRTFDADVSDVFWLAVTLCCALALLLVGLAPVAAGIVGKPGVASLVQIATLALPLQPFAAIYSGELHRSLRFKTIARIYGGVALVQNGSAIAFAALGFGAFSLVLPTLLVAGYAAIALRLAVGRIPIARPRPARWPGLLAPCGWLMLNAGFVAVQQNAPGLIVGTYHDERVTGLFYWGMSMAAQIVFLLANSLTNVFFASLAKLNDEPERQRRAVIELARLLVAVTAPVCALQAALAEPFVRLLFAERWQPAVPVVAWMSIGVLAQPLSVLASALLLARSESRLACGLSAGSALLVSAACVAGAARGAQATIAVWVALGLLAGNLVAGWVAFVRAGLRAADLVRACGLAFAAALVLWRLGAWLAQELASLGPAATLAVVGTVMVALYAALVAFAMPEVRDGLVARIRQAGRP